MRLAATVFALLLSAGAVFAAETEGVIKSIDTEQMTITLEDGQTYKLPGEMDVSTLSEGMDVVIAFREVDNGVKQITDMVLPE
jgi:outer membrane lipoprotein SlyB